MNQPMGCIKLHQTAICAARMLHRRHATPINTPKAPAYAEMLLAQGAWAVLFPWGN
jgi:hypothetical protein